jgi:hypothetical protein
MHVLLRTGTKVRLPHSGTLNLDGRNCCVLLHEAMREDDRLLAMEKVQQPILHTLRFDPKLIDAVPEVVRMWPAELVATGGQQFDSSEARQSYLL